MKKKLLTLLAVVVMAAGVLTLAACAKGNVGSEGNNLTLIVVDVDGAPVEGVEVTLLEQGNKPTKSDANGVVTFTNLKSGLYAFKVEKPKGRRDTVEYAVIYGEAEVAETIDVGLLGAISSEVIIADQLPTVAQTAKVTLYELGATVSGKTYADIDNAADNTYKAIGGVALADRQYFTGSL